MVNAARAARMNYAEQQQYLNNSHAWAAGFAGALFALAALCLGVAGAPSRSVVITFGLIVAAVAVSLSYTPDYLHVTVNPGKAARWEVRIRWRVLGAALVIGLFSASNAREAIVVLLAVVWLVGANLMARSVAQRYAAVYFLLTDFALLGGLLLTRGLPLLQGTVLLAAAAHLSIVICQKRCFLWAGVVVGASGLLLFASSRRVGADSTLLLAAVALLALSALATAWLVH